MGAILRVIAMLFEPLLILPQLGGSYVVSLDNTHKKWPS